MINTDYHLDAFKGAAVYLVLYDRLVKQFRRGEISLETVEECLHEDRGWKAPEEVVYVRRA